MTCEFDHVIELTDGTFHSFLEKHDLVLVAFAWPWLPKVQRFSVVYEAAAAALQDPKDVKFTWVDLTSEDSLANEFPISRVPTITLFKAGKPVGSYRGAWISSELVSYGERQLLPVVSLVTATTLLALREFTKVLFVGYFDGDDADSIKAFRAVANAHHQEHVFGLCTDQSLADVEVVRCPGIVVYKDFDERKTYLQDRNTNKEEAIWSFVSSASMPLIMDIRPEIHDDLIQAGLPLGYIFVNSCSAEQRSRLVSLVQPFAVQYKDVIQFGFVDTQSSPSWVEDMHLDSSADAHWPTFGIRDPANSHRYLFDKQTQSLPTQQQLSEFLRLFFSGTLQRDIKSELAPMEPQQNAVQTIVGTTFDALVLDSNKDVFIDYYTQSCAPCKVMAPEWEKLAQLYKADSSGCNKILIGKMDAEANDVSEDIRGFPWLLLYPSGKKDNPVQYLGKRFAKEMALFVKEYGTHQVDVVRD